MGLLAGLKVRDGSAPALGVGLLVVLSLATLGCGSPSTNGPHGDGDGDGDTAQGDTDTDGTTVTVIDDDLMVGDTDTDDESDCERELRFEAVPVGAPAPFDVIIIADHSDSLSWSRDDLAAGLAGFLDEVRGHEVRFFVLTPTQYGASSEAAALTMGVIDPVQWNDPETGLAYENAMTEYSQSCTDASGVSIACPTGFEANTPDYTLVGNWTFLMPEPIATIHAETSLAELEVQRQAISDAILGLGTEGSSDEQPVCTLHRYLDQERTLLPENAVFLLLSDEDDNSDPKDCLLSHKVECETRESVEMYLHRAQGRAEHRSFDCTPINDQGEQVGEPVPQYWYTTVECTAPRACNADDIKVSQDACPSSHRMENCTILCEEGNVHGCLLEKSETVVDACNSPFVYGGVSYNNLLEYCRQVSPEVDDWGACETYLSGPSQGCSHPRTPVSTAASMADMALEARGKAESVFGPGGFSFKLVGFDPAFACEPQAGQSYLNNLKGVVEDDSQVFPICEDYSGTLSQVRDFATGLIQNEYQLELGSDEGVDAVHIVSSDGSLRELGPTDYTYDPATGILHIEKNSLHATDQAVELDVGRECIIR